MLQGSTIISLILTYRYFIIFPIACVEGPFISLIVGFLIHLGYLEFIPSFLVLILGDLIPDSIYYYIGRKGNEKKIVEKYSSRLKGIAVSFSVLEKLWANHPKKTMFFSKLAYGLSIPFLISAGLVRMSFKKFIAYSIPASLFQYGLLTAVGYYLGKSYQLAEKYVKYGYILVAIVFIIFIAIYIYFVKRSRAELEKMEKVEEKEASK